jgi:hypothetical protein
MQGFLVPFFILYSLLAGSEATFRLFADLSSFYLSVLDAAIGVGSANTPVKVDEDRFAGAVLRAMSRPSLTLHEDRKI